MSPGSKVSSTNVAAPSGRSFATADLSLTSLETKDHAEGEFVTLVWARRAATQSATARTINTTMKILRNVYMTPLALVPTPFKANNGLRDLDLDQTTSRRPRVTGAKRKGTGTMAAPLIRLPQQRLVTLGGKPRDDRFLTGNGSRAVALRL
jgi:hypothetical protein